MTLKLIPAGEFMMGSPADDKGAFDNEKPQHRVTISRPFYLGVTEVTQGQYRAVTGQSPSSFKGSDDLPVECVSWYDALAFCNSLSAKEGRTPFYRIEGQNVEIPAQNGEGYRLPTEGEWEYACRAGIPGRFGFGDDDRMLDLYAWHAGNSDGKTHPVGQKRPNSLGLYDMHGNVWERCWDGFSPNYFRESPTVDPSGPSEASDRVSRGGSWVDWPHYCRSALRWKFSLEDRGYNRGFRLARGKAAS
jgi:formylglycine-generating enzyme required for sulfatase activity